MNIALPLENMSVEEKILTMELIWNDLSAQITNITSPHWHKDILNEREQSVKQGVETPIDWEIAKRNLRHKLKYYPLPSKYFPFAVYYKLENKTAR